MTTPSGQISASNVSTELLRASNAQMSINDPTVRSLAGATSGQISYSTLRNRTYLDYTLDTIHFEEGSLQFMTGINTAVTLQFFPTLTARTGPINYSELRVFKNGAYQTSIAVNNTMYNNTITVNNNDSVYFDILYTTSNQNLNVYIAFQVDVRNQSTGSNIIDTFNIGQSGTGDNPGQPQ